MLDWILTPYESVPISWFYLELFSAIMGVVSVYFSYKNHIWVFPTGILCTVISTYVLFLYGLLGDMIINIYYTVVSVVGWLEWRKLNNQSQNMVSINNKLVLTTVFISICGGLGVYVLYYITNRLTPIAIWDCITTALFFGSMYLMAKRVKWHWIGWIIANIISIPLYAYKGMNMYVIQFIILLILAIMGWLQWHKNDKNDTKTLNI